MNTIEALLTIKEHLLSQGRRSVDDITGKCMYRSPDGTKCAIGCLIPDHLYNVSLEGYGVLMIRKEISECIENISIEALSEAQNIHDNGQVENWERLMNDLIQKYKDRETDNDTTH